MRNPTIHIRLSHFAVILKDVGIKNPQAMAERIFAKAFPYSVNTRTQVTGDKTVRDKANKVIAASKQNDITVSMFNSILSSSRREAGHKFFKEILQSDSSYIQLKEVAMLAVQFCRACGFADYHVGCKVYIGLGLDFMKKSNQYNLTKFKYYDPKIYAAYESLEALTVDTDKEGTARMCDLYILLLAEYAGIARDDLTKPETYTHFLHARIEADNVGADYEDWLRAQFEELGRMYDAVPNPNQIASEKAVIRYYDYMKQSGHKTIVTEEIISPAYEESKSDFESRYQEKLKAKNKQ